jgi:hypothetical protein
MEIGAFRHILPVPVLLTIVAWVPLHVHRLAVAFARPAGLYVLLLD